MAKGIGNGFPVGAIAIAPDIEPRYGMLGTTFGGNHLACAAAEAVADVMMRDDLVGNAAEVGDYLLGELRRLDGVSEVRGRGLMIGVELPKECGELRKRLIFDEHIFTGGAGKNIVRLLPALNITRDMCDLFLEAFRRQLTLY